MYLFTGNRDHKLDGKGRVVIPSDIAEAVRQQGEGLFFLVRSKGGPWLEAYPADVYKKFAVQQEPSPFEGAQGGKRAFFETAEKAPITGPGRIGLPKKFLRYFPDGVVRVCGLNTYLELWDPALWDRMVGEDGQGPAAGATVAPTA